MDDLTRREIDKVVWSILKDAGLTQPPIRIEDLLGHLKLYRTYYDLQNPGFCDKAKYKLLVAARKAARALRKINLVAVLFQDEKRIVIDANLPPIKHDWPSFHECAHRIVPWHVKHYTRADLIDLLTPMFNIHIRETGLEPDSSIRCSWPTFGNYSVICIKK